MIYIIFFFLLLAIELLYFKIADRYNIIDKPNNRSSHTLITLRGGGIIFPIAITIAFFLGYVSPALTSAVVIVAVISFIDDVKPLSQLPRVLCHCFALLMIFYDLDLLHDSVWVLLIVFVLIIGWINAFNFMDGINGITVLYAFVAIVSFSYLPNNNSNLSVLISMGIACIVFGIFNVRKKAKSFAGDVGSISMAVFLAYFMIKTILETQQIGYILMFSIYGIDACVTIANRLIKKENIFEAHRTHLYQYLANELGISHVLVSLVYALTQLGINIIVILLASTNKLSTFMIVGILVLISTIYLITRIILIRFINKKAIK
ncbi:UDP-GlcNAc--UDP-phosphate GlcNAc-1-phosphate transferase [Flavobacterium chilense]|uniref:UDP-N-acetylmuramyl pentapeptide phosphotransferase/UDP-N-acetylglucosamine-1-phosphate transferase n=1 Tax=Flavobacterium chilense TaxID=946677 RepID=A0A1M7GT42_9FLAO|nr:UDP-GlcNAc--UDP-phosphate GlcNAc-1-phosphate transferase [Flavobacterium chilense]SHM19009.1 UDP-N-acetylmuramyl pentapeptide phosphotransferase/UDP-N-acetylglucosamine-1-phosphate transferase [Flavobacterium chilense]